MADAVGTVITPAETPAIDPKAAEAAAAAEAAKAAVAAPSIPDKFKNADGSVNTEALLASYQELEKKQGAAPKEGEEKPALKEGEAPKPADPSKEEKALTGVLKAAGLELTPFNEEFAKDGALSDDSYAKLEKAGFDKATVDTYIRGVQAANADVATAITEIKAVAGGDEGYDAMTAWAAANLSKEQVAEFNEAVQSGKAGIAKAAVTALKASFDKAEGVEPSLIGGGGKPTGEVFRSWSEMETAMKDPRYRNDIAYTKDVEAKAMRSNVNQR